MLEFIRGDTTQIQVKVQRPRIDPLTGEQAVAQNGKPIFDPVNLTGATLTMTARDRRRTIVFTVTTPTAIVIGTPASSGLAVATIAPSVTETMTVPTFLEYDVQMIEADGTKTTVARGEILVSEDQTRG